MRLLGQKKRTVARQGVRYLAFVFTILLALGVILPGLSGCAGKPAGSQAADDGQEQDGNGQPAGSQAAGDGQEQDGNSQPVGDEALGDSQEMKFPYAFLDSTGAEVTLDGRPQKTAVLFSSLAEVWKLSGGEITITVGETVERGFCGDPAVKLVDGVQAPPLEAAAVKLVDGGAGKVIDNELLVSYQPDFVIGSADIQAHVETAELLREAGIPCALFRVDSFEDYLSMLEICTAITGEEECFRKYGEQVKVRVEEVCAAVSSYLAGGETEDVPVQKRILFIRSGSGESSAKAKTAEQHFAAEMLEELGVYNIADNASVLLDGLSLEEILAEDPDYIFIATMGDEEAAKTYMDSVLASQGWGQLTAVREGNYTYLPKELFQFKPNAKWDEAYGYLAGLLYPELAYGDEEANQEPNGK